MPVHDVTLEMPGEPEHERIDKQGATAHTFTCGHPQGLTDFVVTVYDIPEIPPDQQRQRLDAMKTSFARKNSDNRLLREVALKVGNHLGVELRLTTGTFDEVARLFLADDRFLVQSVSVTRGTLPTDDVRRFFDSLTVDGQPVDRLEPATQSAAGVAAAAKAEDDARGFRPPRPPVSRPDFGRPVPTRADYNGPSSIASSGRPVDETTPLRPGMLVQVEWGRLWYAADVLRTLPDGRVQVHYRGWSSGHDEIVPRSRVQLPHEAVE